MEPTTHIVYRSRMQAEADQFWWDLILEHPDATLATLGVAALLVVSLVAYSQWPRRKRRVR